MSGYSFDSNILLDMLNGSPKARAELERAPQRWISRITWTEIMSKVRPEERRVIDAFFADFTIDEITEPISRRAAELRFERPSLRLPDAIILASAQVHQRILVTRNTKDFPARMPGIRVPYTTP